MQCAQLINNIFVDIAEIKEHSNFYLRGTRVVEVKTYCNNYVL